MYSRQLRWLLPCVYFYCLALPNVGMAQSASGSRQILTLHEAIARSAQSNPELKAFGYALSAQDGRTLQAGLKPNPELVIDLEDALGTGERRGFSGAQTSVALRQQFERGAAEVRVAAARAERSALDAEMVEKQLDIAVETARRFAEVLSDQARLDVTQTAITLAKQSVAAVQLRVQAAKAPDAELARALAQLARVALEHEDVEHELLTAKYQLAAMWGAEEITFDIAAGSLENLPKLAEFKRYVARIDANPSLQKFDSEAQLRAAELALAQQRRKPAWQLHAGVRRFEQGNDFAGIVGVSIPLSWNDRGQGETASAQANLEKVDADRIAAQVKLKAHLFSLYQELGHALHVIQKLDQEVLPRMQDALKQTDYAYTRGRYSYLELLAAQRELLELKVARIEAASDAMRYAIEIDRLIGAVPGSADALTQMTEMPEATRP
jgi:outer membrane protein, heavy metal efflux system